MQSCPHHQISFESGDYCPGCVAAMALLEKDQDHETPIATLGDYEVISELGRGGMGVVYLARQVGLNRRVALKLLPSGNLAGQEFIERFRREGELAASLQHPDIVRIYEAGQIDNEFFYSMELITGGSLADWPDGKTHRPADAARILQKIALAVDHAHRAGILHRDLKPSNILIDDAGNPKVADFGLARMLGSQNDITLATHSFGTPAYMAPELIRDPRAAAPASDIYSLGAILYFLLSRRPPFVSASLDELLRQVKECEPPAPRLLDPSIPKDLQKICLKALDKYPAKRYPTAGALAEDLQRFLEGKPVIARPSGLLLKASRLARRFPGVTSTLLILLVVLAAGVTGVILQSNLANQRADETARKASELRLNLYASDIAAASTALRRGDTPVADEILSRWAHPAAPEEDPRGFEWNLLREEARPARYELIESRNATITAVAFSMDGSEFAVADQRGTVFLHPGTRPFPVSASEIAAIPEQFGRGWMAGASSGEIMQFDRTLEFMAGTSGRQFSLASTKPRAAIGALSKFHWTGKGGSASVIDWQTRKVLRDFPGEWRHVVISPDGGTIALAALRGGLQLVDIATGHVRHIATPAPVWALSFDSTGSRLAAGSRRAAIIWKLDDDDSPAPLLIPHDLTVWTTAFSPDGKRFLTSSSDRRVRIWNMDQPAAAPLTLSGHRGEVWCAAFSPDGKSVIAGGKDGDVLRWPLDTKDTAEPTLGHDHPNAPFFSPDGRKLVTYHRERSHIHDLFSGEHTHLPSGIMALGFSADGRSLLVVDGKSRTGHATTSEPANISLNSGTVFSKPAARIRATTDGRWIIRIETDGRILLLDPSDGHTAHQFNGPTPGMRHFIAGSPDSHLFAIGGDGEKSVILHNIHTGTTTRLPSPSLAYYYVCAAFSPDGRLLAAGDLSGPIRIWETASGRLVATLPGHPEETSAVAFSPDGRTLASMGFHQDLKLWQTATWRELHSVNLPEAAHHLVFSPGGKRLLATLGRDTYERIGWFPGD